MALSPRLKSQPNISEEELIQKGGTSGQKTTSASSIEAEEVKRVNLRLPAHYLYQVDQLLAQRPGKVSRNTWIIEAIVEKLGKEENASEVNLTSSQP